MSRVIAIVVILGLLGFGTSRAIDWWNFNVNTPISSTSHTVPFHIDTGETASQIGTDLYNLHLIRSTIAWDLYDRVTSAGPKFQAGSFVLNTNMSMSQIVSALQHGRPDEKTITFPEGFPIRYQAQLVDQKQIGTSPSYITGADYLKAAHDQGWASLYDFLPKQSNNPDYPFEGYLFPDTYLVDPAAGARGLVKEQLDQFSAVFSADWRAQIAQATAARPAEDIRSIVILASMVDREANNKTSTDRGNVCSVYYNRLAINMPLGVDATLLYGLGRLSPEPTGTELAMDNSYNTRKHAGLPPSAISNPGRAALQACINPPKTSYLFYFTDRVGTTHFETNQRDFDADVAKYGTSGS
ncbi:MAG TPA: endolytic transglycosylase MltG [Candidatus Dormibacteraeota bacterium]|nr:endolytic transglycosylase MltG [Candidatus Dormibacteraeota bacterium]